MTLADQHLWTWLDDLKFYPVRPATYGADPWQPSPQLPSRFEGMAQLKGGWTPAKAAARSRGKQRRQRRRR